MQSPFLTVAEVAELLKINQQTVRNWIDSGALRAVRVGSRRVRVRESDLDAFLQASTEATVNAARRPPAGEAEDPSALLWTRLGIALTESSDALADDDLAKLSHSLNALADAAGTLADALGGGASG